MNHICKHQLHLKQFTQKHCAAHSKRDQSLQCPTPDKSLYLMNHWSRVDLSSLDSVVFPLLCCCFTVADAARLSCNRPVFPVAGRSAGQVWSGGRDPAGCTQRDGDYVLVTSAGQAGQLCQRNTVLHGAWCLETEEQVAVFLQCELMKTFCSVTIFRS